MTAKYTANCPVHGSVTIQSAKRPTSCPEGVPACGHALTGVINIRKPGSGGLRPGQGRPKSENKLDLVPLNVKIVAPAKQRLADLAEASGSSQAIIIEHLLAQVETLPDKLGGFRDE
jgi:hypothetical protein